MKIVSIVMFGVSVACVSSGALNGMLLKHIEGVNDRIYCIAETSGDVEQMRNEAMAATTKFAELINGGAPLNECTESGMTPLMAAARGGLGSFVEVLLNAGAKADAVDENGFTALDYAIFYSMLPSQANPFAFIPWIVTIGFRGPGRRQCVEFLMRHLHLEKPAVETRIIELVNRLKQDMPTEAKNTVCADLSRILFAELPQ